MRENADEALPSPRSAIVRSAAVVAAWLLSPLSPATAASATLFSISEVVSEVQRQLAAADDGTAAIRLDEASVDLILVEGSGSGANDLAVPGAGYAVAGKEDGGRPSLKRRLLLDVATGKSTKAASGSSSGSTGGGNLTAAIVDAKGQIQEAMARSGGFEMKKLTLDFDFALERDGKGAPMLLVSVSPRDRRIETIAVQGVKVRFSTKER